VQSVLNNLLEQATANDPNRKRYDDVLKRLTELYEKIQMGGLSASISAKLMDLCRAIEHKDFPTALKTQVDLSNVGWAENKNWLQGVKRILT